MVFLLVFLHLFMDILCFSLFIYFQAFLWSILFVLTCSSLEEFYKSVFFVFYLVIHLVYVGYDFRYPFLYTYSLIHAFYIFFLLIFIFNYLCIILFYYIPILVFLYLCVYVITYLSICEY